MRMRSTVPMKIAKTGYIVISALLCVLGVLFIAVPDFSTSLIGVLCGVLLIAFGLIKIVGFFSRDLYRLAFQYDLSFGVLLVALGVVMLVRPKGLMTFICIALGVSVLCDGLFKIQIALDSKRFGIRQWWLIFALAVLTGALGILLMLRPGDGGRVLTVCLGITFLTDGILNFCTVISAVKIIKDQKPDAIEGEFTEK